VVVNCAAMTDVDACEAAPERACAVNGERPYDASKLAAKRYLCAYNGVYNLPAVILRYFIVYRPPI